MNALIDFAFLMLYYLMRFSVALVLGLTVVVILVHVLLGKHHDQNIK